MKFIPYHRIIDPNENSFDLLSVNKLDKEKNSNLFLRKKINFLPEEDKSISSEEKKLH